MKKLTTILFAALFISCAAYQICAQQIAVSGQLTPTVEAGGWLIVGAAEKYLILNAANFSGESWFKAGARVEATGELRRGTPTIYQEGVPFEARTLRPVENASGGVGGASARLTSVAVTGDARVSAQPDTATISVAVVTQNQSAAGAQQQNAALTATVLGAVRAAAGSGAEIKTSGYQLIPQRVYRENQPPTITGYEARNTISATLRDLTKIGPVIDAAIRAGANNIDGIAFSLRDDRGARNEALAEASREALEKAKALARALGGRLVRIVAVEESGAAPRPVLYAQREALAATAADTPIEVGALEINAQVRLVAEIEVNVDPR